MHVIVNPGMATNNYLMPNEYQNLISIHHKYTDTLDNYRIAISIFVGHNLSKR